MNNNNFRKVNSLLSKGATDKRILLTEKLPLLNSHKNRNLRTAVQAAQNLGITPNQCNIRQTANSHKHKQLRWGNLTERERNEYGKVMSQIGARLAAANPHYRGPQSPKSYLQTVFNPNKAKKHFAKVAKKAIKSKRTCG